MAALSIDSFAVTGPLLITPERRGDDRGYFAETWNAAAWAAEGLPPVHWVQDNEAFSRQPGTTRGLHFQSPPMAQAKLVRVARGAIFDVAVDIRKGSPTYGRAVTVRLEAERGDQLFVPPGFAHGYQTLTVGTLVLYKCDAPYDPSTEGGLLWSDAELGIDWPMPEHVTMSGRDFTWPTLHALKSPFTFGENEGSR